MPETRTAADFAAFDAAFNDFSRATRRARARFAARSEADGELSLSQFHLVEPLSGSGAPLAVCALAEAADVSAPTATRMLDGLERRGLVLRSRDEEDRRVVRVSLTEEGRVLVAARDAMLREGRGSVFEQLPAEEQRSAARLLSSLAAAIEDLVR